MFRRSHPHAPDSSSRGVSPAETLSQITYYQIQVTCTAFLAPDRLPNNTITSDYYYQRYSDFPSIPPDDSHTTTLSHKHNRSALFKNARQTECFYLSPQGSPPVRRELPATTRGCKATTTHLLWTITHEIPIPTTVPHTNRHTLSDRYIMYAISI